MRQRKIYTSKFFEYDYPNWVIILLIAMFSYAMLKIFFSAERNLQAVIAENQELRNSHQIILNMDDDMVFNQIKNNVDSTARFTVNEN